MKKLSFAVIAILILSVMLQGCSSGSDIDDNVLPSEVPGTEVPHETPAPTPAATVTPERTVTAETAYEGVGNYCRIELAADAEDDGYHVSGLETGEETESEYCLIYRSYTGTLMRFYVDKASGTVRMTEYVPMLDIEDDAGSFDLFDYIGREISPTPGGDTEPTATPEAHQKQEGHYVFQPKVCSVYMEEVFGKTMCDTWCNLVDAVMAGEDTFACPDQYTYDWVMGQFPDLCFPVLNEIIDYAFDRENSVVDGVASFTYRVSREEAAARIAEFAGQIESILNEALEDDYSDFEKVLGLYDYFSRNYEYDYETFEKMKDEYVELSPIRFLNSGLGICQEISDLYSYLLMQVGVEATVMSGKRSYDNAAHQWSYVRINGHDYHVDPTYVLSDKGVLSYLMMTDDQRLAEDSYDKSMQYITSHYSKDNPHPEYAAVDDTFSEIWTCMFDTFFPDENKLICWKYDDNGERQYIEFDYTGY